ncbi:MAG: hypothetical protein JXB04_07125 [Kiritimatiellae bacterium]|nr:hypothetical protein [Kiritimatiellia bacterium]
MKVNPILDEAFTLAKDACDARADAEAREHLGTRHPDLQREDLDNAYLKARALADACYDFGNACREKRTTDEQALREMHRRFPGFSEATCRAALSHGYFVSR